MSLTDTIGADLQAMAEAVNRSWQEVVAVDQAVEQIGARAVASGFAGIAVGLARVREMLGQARTRLSQAGGVLGEASESVGAVARQPSPQEAITTLAPVVAALNDVDGHVTAAMSAVDDTRRLVTVSLQGGQPGSTLSRLQQVTQILTTVRARGAEARQHVGAALAQARQVGDLGKLTPGGGAGSRPPTIAPATADHDTTRPNLVPHDDGAAGDGSADVPRPVGPDWVPADPATLPDGVRPAVGRLQARPAGASRPTLGLFNGEEVFSGGGERSLAADLDHDPLRGPPVTFYDHAESKVAARMRRTGSAEADLAVDNTVCGTNDRDQTYPWTCDKILPAILPAGSRLRMWVTRDGGATWWHRVYTGTGERITR